MTPTETVMLARFVKALCPQQQIDSYTPDAWHEVLGHLELGDCRLAAAACARRKPFVAPAEIIAELADREAEGKPHSSACRDSVHRDCVWSWCSCTCHHRSAVVRPPQPGKPVRSGSGPQRIAASDLPQRT
jgi:hypothetical protein